MQGDQGQALVDATQQGIVHAAAWGHGQDEGHGAPRLEGAKATIQAIGRRATSFAGKRCSAASHDPSARNGDKGAHEEREASLPETPCRARDPRCALQERQKPHTDVQCPVTAVPYAQAQDRSRGPTGQVVQREARRHKIGTNLSRRYEAKAADGGACQRREPWVQNAATRCQHLAVSGEPAQETLSQQMIAKIDTPEARQLYGQRLASVEPVFGTIRSQKR